jgi:hypothetical protein
MLKRGLAVVPPNDCEPFILLDRRVDIIYYFLEIIVEIYNYFILNYIK